MVEGIYSTDVVLPRMPQSEPALIEENEIKAILYLGIIGEVTLPVDKENHEVDILA
jgi:hypothetical protein